LRNRSEMLSTRESVVLRAQGLTSEKEIAGTQAFARPEGLIVLALSHTFNARYTNADSHLVQRHFIIQ
jgi:hypothetical protein